MTDTIPIRHNPGEGAPEPDDDETSLGKITWHCSNEGSGPDVGMMLGLGGGNALWVGEVGMSAYEDAGEAARTLGNDGGWWLTVYSTTTGGEVLAKFIDADAAREFFDNILGALVSKARTATPADPVRRADSGWQPIETAPRDEGWIAPQLFAVKQTWGWEQWVGQCDAGDIWLGRTDDGSCFDTDPPTHWRPLPNPPSEHPSGSSCLDTPARSREQAALDLAEQALKDTRRRLALMAGMCGIPNAVEACRLICNGSQAAQSRIDEALARISELRGEGRK